MDADTPQVTSHPLSDRRRDAVATRLAGLGLTPVGRQLTSRRLLDSFDARLAAAGLQAILTERIRGMSSAGTPAGVLRLTVSGGRGGVAVVELPEVPSRPSDLPPGPLRDRLTELLGVRVLVSVIDVTGTEQVWSAVDPDGRTVAEVTLLTDLELVVGDLMVPVDGDRGIDLTAVPSTLVEVRTVRGEAEIADRVRAELADEGLGSSSMSVVELLADLIGIDRTGRGSRLVIDLDHRMPALDGYREVFGGLLAVIEANRAGAAGAVDPEFLHDLRVGVRRTRSVLRHARRVLPEQIRDRAREGFGRLGTLTGHARDLDVQVLDWPVALGGFDASTRTALDPVLHHFVELREAAHDEVRAGLADPATEELLAWWRAWLEAPVDGMAEDRDAGRRLAPVVARHLERAQGRLLRDARDIDDRSPADHLHQLRKDAKALRYLFECFASILPDRPRKRFVRRLKSFQDLLGTHQDAEVQGHLLAEVAHELAERGASVDTLLAVGRLIEVHDVRRIEMRARFTDEFAAYDETSTHDAFAAVVGELRS